MDPNSSGTDVLGMSTKAVASPDGSSFKIDGAKMWITNGTVDGRTTGDVFLVYARTGPGRQDISMFLVEKARESRNAMFGVGGVKPLFYPFTTAPATLRNLY